MTLERDIVRSIVRLAEKRGYWAMKIHGGPYQRSGIPDLLVLRQGRAAWLEVKRPGRRATPLQARTMRDIAIRGGCPAEVVTSRQEASEFFDRFERGENVRH